MKIGINRSGSVQGGALLVTLLTVLVIGITLTSYLTFVASQNRSVMRSLAWNATIPVLEAGIEEAMAQLHYTGITNLSANGWTYTSGYYQKERTLGDGSGYVVKIQPVEPPVIIATGVVPTPLNPAGIQATAGAVTAAATTSTADFVRRTVRVATERPALFAKGLVAKGQIDLNGNNAATDSFDSSDPNYNTNGRYDPNKNKDNGDVATNAGITNSLNAGNAKIKGHVATGPGGSISIGPNGSIGNESWVDAGKVGIQPGYAKDDMNLQFLDVVAPFTSAPIPGAETVGGTNYDYVLKSGEYRVSSLSGTVLVTGEATLYVADSLSMAGKDYVYLQPGAKLTVYCAAASASLGGNGVINNSGNALDFQYYGLPSNTSLSLSGNAAFTGVIFAPNADFSLNGGGKTSYDFVGASVTKTAKMNGHFLFHYDEALAVKGPKRDYIPISWNEMHPLYGFACTAY